MDNPDIINEILSYTGRLPGRYARTSSSFAEAALIANRYVLQDLNQRYPLWNLSINNIPENLQDTDTEYQILEEIEDIILYHLNKAATDDDWDSFQIIALFHMLELLEAEYKKPFMGLIYTAIYIAHINDLMQLSRRLYDLFRSINNLTSMQYEMIDQYYGAIDLEDLTQYEFDIGFVSDHVRQHLLQNYDSLRRELDNLLFAIILRDIIGSTIILDMRDSDEPSLQIQYHSLRFSYQYPHMDENALAAAVYYGVELQEDTVGYLIEMLYHTRYFTTDIVEILLDSYQDEEYIQPAVSNIPAVVISKLIPDSEMYQEAIQMIDTPAFLDLSADRKIAILQLAGKPITVDSIQLFTS